MLAQDAPPDRKRAAGMNRFQERGFTLIEMIVVVGLLGVLLAIAVPGLQRARQAGNEGAAIGSLRAVASAQQMYAATCASGYYAPSLTVLGTPPPGALPFISPDLGAADPVEKSGFTFTVGSSIGPAAAAPISCNGTAAGSSTGGYYALATPTLGAGTHAYGVNGLGTIYFAQQMAPLAMTDMSAPPGARPIPE